jgi:molybdopterin-guanine dinucleotide biosynthesis protein A
MTTGGRATGERRPPIGAVLAGGLAKRMDEPKTTAQLAGRPLIDHPLSALARAGLEAVVVAKAGTALPKLDVPVWVEPDQPLHPLAGILAALDRAGGRTVLVIGCDMPFVTPELVAHLASLEGRLAVPAAGGRLHPLLGLYGPGLTDALRSALQRLEPLQRTVEGLDPVLIEQDALASFGDPERLLFNVNTAADLERARAIAGG